MILLEKLKPNFAAKNIRVENNIPDSLPALTADKPKLYRLFELLLKDEAVSLPEGSQVTLTAQAGDSSPDKGEIHVQLSDNGPGLPKDALRLIFDPFVVRSDSPMEYGIHLMACYFIVHHHGGKIDAKSDDGKGTVFTLRLPINPTQAPPTQNDQDFLQKVLLSDTLWEKLISAE